MFRARYFVLAPSYHGATLLAKLLNAHPDIATLADTFPTNSYDQTCGCGTKISRCCFWTSMRDELGADWPTGAPELMPRFPGQDQRRSRRLMWSDYVPSVSSHDRLIRTLSKSDLAVFSRHFESFLTAMKKQPSVRGDVFVDGSKSIGRLKSLLAAGSQVDGIIHLTRHPADFVGSALRKRRMTIDAAMRYRFYHERVRRLSRQLPTLAISYEALTSETDRQLARIFQFLQVPPRSLAALKQDIDREWHFIGSASVRRFAGDISRSSHDIGALRRLAVQTICGHQATSTSS